jgi:drug/metabolite transporter (DMT)-like permease
MPNEATSQPAMTWLLFALLTVVSWGVYGIFLHKGQVLMGDPVNGRYKAFLLVGVAYFITAVLAPILMLLLNKSDWHFTGGGAWWSLIAGIVGAVGAFGVLLAFGAKGSPAVVMSIIFAGAPIVNAVVAVWLANQWTELRWQFVTGIVLAAVGGYLVTIYKPAPKPHGPPTAHVAPVDAPTPKP